jgi:hypothetical protein
MNRSENLSRLTTTRYGATPSVLVFEQVWKTAGTRKEQARTPLRAAMPSVRASAMKKVLTNIGFARIEFRWEGFAFAEKPAGAKRMSQADGAYLELGRSGPVGGRLMELGDFGKEEKIRKHRAKMSRGVQ